jgi:hypothetical protein
MQFADSVTLLLGIPQFPPNYGKKRSVERLFLYRIRTVGASRRGNRIGALAALTQKKNARTS